MIRIAHFPQAIVVCAVLSLGISAGLVTSAVFGSSGTQLIVGDVDCSGEIAPRDGQAILKNVLAQTALSQTEPCPDIGSILDIGGTPTPQPAFGLSRNNPVPAGQSFRVPEGWELSIVHFFPDATQLVLDENQFNDPPASGHVFAMVRVKITNISADDPADPEPTFSLRMVGSNNVTYTNFQNSCGVTPDDFALMSTELFRGGSVEGNVCYEVPSGETGFEIFTHFFLADEADTRWFDVQ